MDTIIIGQGYNLETDTCLGKELIKQFQTHRYNSFTCLVAFASQSGVSALTKEVLEAKDRGMSIKVVLGVDQKGTSKEALEEVLSWDVDAKIYHTADFNIFHPKVYLFENEDIFTLVVGSNNLTVPGLVQNIECSLMIKDIRSNPILGEFYGYWNGILSGEEVNLYPITQELIDNLYHDGVITLEKQRAERYDIGGDDTVSESEENRIVFNKVGVQRLPVGFSPRRKKRQVKVKVAKGKQNSRSKKEEVRGIGEQILITEIAKGDRWKQVNFPIKFFQEFFGARKGDNTYKIELMNISNGGELGDIEERQAVTVSSNNFRFEINCEETKGTYPVGDKRPIGLFIKLDSSEFAYQVLMPGYHAYDRILKYLEMEAKPRKTNELRRVIVDVEAVHALYPELII